MAILCIAMRFFTGQHLDGKRRSQRGRVLPRYADYFWNRWSRKRRALWRNLVFWAIAGFAIGWFIDRPLALFSVAAFTPFAILWAINRGLNAVSIVVSFADSDGVTDRYRVVRPAVRRKISRVRPARWRVRLPDGGPVPPDLARAILADNAESGGSPVTSLREIADNQGDDVSSMPPSSRSRTIARRKKAS